MTDPGGVLLDREQLERAFTALGDRLVRRGVVADVFILAEMIGVDSAAAAVQICAEFFPDEDVSPRSAAVLQELFG